MLNLMISQLFEYNLNNQMVKFSFKAGKDAFQIDHSPEESFEDFQAKVFTLTDIPPKNVKILFKAKMIKDNETLFTVPQNFQLIVMGTKSGKELKVTGQIKIETAMMEQKSIPTRYGLVNVGNTCYMNSAIQLLKSIPSFRDILKKSVNTNNNDHFQLVTKALTRVINDLDGKDVRPEMFVAMFLQAHPEYLPLGTQHDSDQFMQQLLTNVSNANPANAKALKNAFEIQFVDSLKNQDIADDEQFSINYSMKLCCSLGGVEKEMKIGTLLEGIKLSLDTKLEKLSAKDNLNHIYEKKTRFNSLPEYMFVQMIRFFWKQASDLPHSKPVATKICKSIDFSTKLDIFQFCTPDLQKKLEPGRLAVQENEKRAEIQYKKQYEQYKHSLGDTNRPETRVIEEFKAIWKKKNRTLQEGLETGMYELSAVVTHLGNSIESGHYMAWVKESEEEWMKYDDDSVYPQPAEKITQLRGGQPNLEIAYVLLFKKVFTKPL